jgi:hypothetical protein
MMHEPVTLIGVVLFADDLIQSNTPSPYSSTREIKKIKYSWVNLLILIALLSFEYKIQGIRKQKYQYIIYHVFVDVVLCFDVFRCCHLC